MSGRHTATVGEIFHLAVEHQKAGRLEEAEGLYRRILEARPDLSEVAFNLGFALQMQGRLGEALATYREVLARRPDFAGAHARSGDVQFWLGRLGEAGRHYEAALELAPGDAGFAAALDQVRAIEAARRPLLETRRAGGRLDLRDVTFLIPCRLESDDRRRNLRVLLAYLTRHLDTRIIVCEDNPGAAEVPAVAAAAGLEPGAYTHIQITGNTTPFTHKAKQINLMAEAATTPVLVVQDTDVVVEPTQYVFARNAVRAGAAMACPFNGLFFDVGADYVAVVARHLSVAAVDLLDPRNTLLYKNSYAGSVFFDRAVFDRWGGFNERFVSWGWEDFEIVRRLERLELRVERLWGPLLHLSHARAVNSVKENPWHDRNRAEFDRVVAMPKAEILAAIAAGHFRRPLVGPADDSDNGGAGEGGR